MVVKATHDNTYSVTNRHYFKKFNSRKTTIGFQVQIKKEWATNEGLKLFDSGELIDGEWFPVGESLFVPAKKWRLLEIKSI